MVKPKRNLGRGLSSLFENMDEIGSGNESNYSSHESVTTLGIDSIYPDSNQPRKTFNQEALEELAQSVKENGIIVPILVAPHDNKGHKIIAGERRYRAARLAGLAEVPVVVRDVASEKAKEFAIIENVQRENLNAIEEAEAYQHLVDSYNYTQNKISEVVGKSRSYVANSLRLLKLPKEVRDLIIEHGVSVGHAKALIATEYPLQVALAIIEEGLTVRQVEELGRNKKSKDKPKEVDKVINLKPLNSELTLLVKHLGKQFGMKLEVSMDGEQRGRFSICFKNFGEFDRILNHLFISFDPTKR